MKPINSIQKDKESPILYIIPQAQLEAFSQKLELIHNSVLTKNSKNIIADEWADENEAQQALKKGTTALWALRKANAIKSAKIGGKTYYSIESIKEYLDKGTNKSK